MKKVKDIYKNSFSSEVNVRDEDISRSPEVISDDSLVFSDISSDEKKDINFRRDSQIELSKKSGKNFDALEKGSLLSRLKSKKTIRIKKKQKATSVLVYGIYLTRYIKSLGYLGRLILVMGCILGILLLGYLGKIIVENRVNSGYEKLITIKDGQIGIDNIRKQINNARFDLLIADVLFTPFSLFLGEKIDSVNHVISGGRHLTHALDDILALYSKTNDFIAEKSLQKIYFTQLFSNIFPELKDIEASLFKSIEDYKNISWLPNEALYVQREEAISQLENFGQYLQVVNYHFTDFLNILGHSERKRYLIVFQNADEIRPNGGFMGSMALLEIFKGRIQLFQKKDVYAIEWDLKKSDYERLPAPKGIDELTENFGLRDANYYLNLKDSSNAIKFFTDEAGIDLDGIVYINQNILLNLLEITGPVYFPAIEKEVSSDNFSEIMSLLVEAKVFKSGTLGTPKQILFDFIEIFIQKLLRDAEYFKYLQSIVHDIESRDIMMWSFNEEENNFLQLMGLRGDIEFDQTLDFVYPVYTSISGNKSDRYMTRNYFQTVKSGENCSYEVDLRIESSHNMTKNKRENILNLIEEYEFDSPNLFEIQGAQRNRQFVRVLLPHQAVIEGKEGMTVVDYGGRQGVEFFITTEVQETVSYEISYLLPNQECSNYNFMLYKQPGIPSFNVGLDIDKSLFNYFNRKEDFYFEKRN